MRPCWRNTKSAAASSTGLTGHHGCRECPTNDLGLLAGCTGTHSCPGRRKRPPLRAVRDLSQAFALAVPHEQALRIRDDVAFFQAVRAASRSGLRARQRPRRNSITPYADRLQAVASEEVIDIFAAAGLKRPDISILSDEFLAEVKGMPQRNLAVELLRKLLSGKSKPYVARMWSKHVLRRDAGRAYPPLSEPRYRGGPGDRGIDRTGQTDARPTSGARNLNLNGGGLGLLRCA